MEIYRTSQGDTFDSISKRIYGNEKLLQSLLEANPTLMTMVVFEAGVNLVIPELSKDEKSHISLAPWRVNK